LHRCRDLKNTTSAKNSSRTHDTYDVTIHTMQYIIILALLLIISITATHQEINDTPVIGVFTRNDEEFDLDVIASSYVKWLESAGAQVIPIHSQIDDDEELEALFRNINGVLFPGGDDTLTSSVKKIWRMAKEANENGDHFPIWGTCLGFEFMLQLESEIGEAILETDVYSTEDISMHLEFTEYGLTESKMFAGQLPYANVRSIAATEPVTYNYHHDGITPDNFLADRGLTDMFEITSVNFDEQNDLPFVSSMEARDIDLYPFYGVQWHPEKNPFEFCKTCKKKDINHSSDAIYVTEAMADVFIREAKKSSHEYTDFQRFPLVWDYDVIRGLYYEQIFIIPAPVVVSEPLVK